MGQTMTTQNELRNAEQAEHPAGDVRREGERLDEARAEFRVSWAAKVAEMRRQAKWARMRAASLHRVSRDIQFAGLVAGALAGPMLLPGAHGFLDLARPIVVGALLGLVVVLPLLFLTQGGAGANQKKADRLEATARELERQVECGDPPAAAASGSTSEGVLLNTGDQSFDEARAEFRAAWSARLAGE